MIKIISGENRGRNILFPTNPKTRPTSQLVKESFFNIVQFQIQNAKFLDLFFGSGQIGIEALSRGAKHVVFVDNSPHCKKQLLKNLSNLKINNNSFKIYLSDVITYLTKSEEIFDVVFLDPPYGLEISDQVLKIVSSHLNCDSTLVVETEKNEDLSQTYEELEMIKQYIYGKKKLTVYKKLKNNF